MTSPRSERGAVPSEGVHAAWDTDPVVPEEAAYHAAVAALTPTFEQRMRRLPQADANAIGKSVGAIDEAISATRASLEETPEDGGLRAELGNEYEQKIQTMNDVLDWTTRS